MLKPRRAVAGLALLLALCGDGSAQAQRRPRAINQPEQSRQQPEAPPQPAAPPAAPAPAPTAPPPPPAAVPDLRGTAQSPLIVQPLPITESPETIARQNREAGERAKAQWWSWFLGVLTLAALAGQLLLLGALAVVMRGAMRLAATAAEAANRNATAFTSAERAYLFIQISSETITDIVGKHARRDPSDRAYEDKTESPGLGYAFKNFGRTVARLREISNHLLYSPEFPGKIDDRVLESIPEELVIEPGKSSATYTVLLDEIFTVSKVLDFHKQRAAFWFYGYVKFDDIFGRQHEFRWRFRYRHGDGGFRLIEFREFPDEAGSA